MVTAARFICAAFSFYFVEKTGTSVCLGSLKRTEKNREVKI